MRASRTRQAVLLLFGSVLAGSALADFEAAFTSPEEAAQVNERTVGVVFERDDHLFDLLEDIELNLSLAAGLRIVPIVGRNHVQNVYDLLYLDGVDLALVRADSIEYVRRMAGMGGTRRLTRNVARVGNEKIVVFAREVYRSLDELSGQPVAFGLPGSGEFVTGTLMFETLGVEVEKIEVSGASALERVGTGELAAMVHLLGSPDELSSIVAGAVDGVGVIALPPDERLAALYRPATLGAGDLPGAIDVGDTLPTYSVDVNLVAYAWNSRNDRTRRVGQFVKALVDRLEQLQGDVSQPEWKEVSLQARTPNIHSSPMVEEALAEREAALERWHERRALSAGDEEDRAVTVTRLGSGRTMIELLEEESSSRGEASGADGPFDGVDVWLSGPYGRSAPDDASGGIDDGTGWRAPEIPERRPVTPDG